jgi:hypothetical protein
MTTPAEQWAALYAAGKVRWMPGMRDAHGVIVVQVYDDGDVYAYDGSAHLIEDAVYRIPASVSVPDFTDPATRGCILAQAREALADPCFHVIAWQNMMGEIRFVGIGTGKSIKSDTEPAAILAAIAAAPPKETP